MNRQLGYTSPARPDGPISAVLLEERFGQYPNCHPLSLCHFERKAVDRRPIQQYPLCRARTESIGAQALRSAMTIGHGISVVWGDSWSTLQVVAWPREFGGSANAAWARGRPPTRRRDAAPARRRRRLGPANEPLVGELGSWAVVLRRIAVKGCDLSDNPVSCGSVPGAPLLANELLSGACVVARARRA
jgi:hypothetical protein